VSAGSNVVRPNQRRLAVGEERLDPVTLAGDERGTGVSDGQPLGVVT
jgi:hypothetical protein